jgi:hypothetical protein
VLGLVDNSIEVVAASGASCLIKKLKSQPPCILHQVPCFIGQVFLRENIREIIIRWI